MKRADSGAVNENRLPLADVRRDPANRRAHPGRNVDMIATALRELGAARSIVIDEDATCMAGNGVLEAAAAAGITTVRVIEAKGDELIAVMRRGLTDAQKRALAIYDNRTAELSEWDAAQLRADVEAGLDLRPWFTEDEAAALLAVTSFGPTPEADQGQLDKTTPITCPNCGHEFTR